MIAHPFSVKVVTDTAGLYARRPFFSFGERHKKRY